MTSALAFRPRNPVVIGVLGGIASGKSTVARLFADCGLHWIDADAEARHVVADPAIAARIRARFGDGVFDTAGELDRAALGRIVFADEVARRDLEEIVHPAVRRAILEAIVAARSAGESVVLDVPLLLERGLIERCDVTVFVDVPDAVRRARAADRGWTEAEFRRREAAQAPADVKKARATVSIPNSESLERTREHVESFLARLLADASRDP